MSETTKRPLAAGRCLCGAVAYEIHGPIRDVVNCHCGQCRRTHGHFAGYTNVRREDLILSETRGLKWYDSSAIARRGFCGTCGASMFYERLEGGRIAVAAGTLDQPSGLKTVANIFMTDKGDYYAVDDVLKAYPGSLAEA